MKRHEIWLATVLAFTAGILPGFYLGRNFPDEPPTTIAPAAANSAVAELLGSDQSPAPMVHEWVNRQADAFQQASENQPTPGLEKAIIEAMQPRDLFGDQARLLLLIEMMRKEDFPVAVEMFRKAKTGALSNSSGGTGPMVWTALWQRFGELDPQNALATALKHRDISYQDREYLEKYLFAGMARNNPQAAADAFLAHPDLPNPHTAASGLMREWTKVDPKAASDWAQKNLTGQVLGTAFYGSVLGLGRNDDISAVTAYVQTVPEGIARKEALLSAKGVIGRNQYLPAQQLLDFVATTRALGARDRQFESQMAKRCATKDPFLAAEFFSAPLPNGQSNDYRELRTVLQSWIRQDPKAAESWAKGQEGTPHHEVVAGEFARAAQGSSEPAAAQP
jgi:hypothetical protein